MIAGPYAARRRSSLLDDTGGLMSQHDRHRIAQRSLDHLCDNGKAKAAVEPFMQAVVANFGNEWEMTSADIDEALAALGKAVA